MNDVDKQLPPENITEQEAARLNRECLCKTLQPGILADKQDTHVLLEKNYENFFADTTVFISPDDYKTIEELIQTIDRVIALPQVAASYAPPYAIHDKTAGVFMGYDFHLGKHGPQLIEINTNAGGPFLNAILLDLQSPCCAPAQHSQQDLASEFITMFMQEWQSQQTDKTLRTLAIVDEHPENQFLYPEFQIARQLFEQNGIKAFIVAPQELLFDGANLRFNDTIIDLVYNRLTDFTLASHPHLLQAYQSECVVLTPNPRHHALYANKRNLCWLTDPIHLTELGVDTADINRLLKVIPKTQEVNAENADNLWKNRRELFFKPLDGFGSRAVYRGDKLTKRVWEEIQQGNYIAQQLVPASERNVLVNGEKISLKMDIRAYVYRGKIQLLAARLYQGQTTNFRTPGGGFAPVAIIS